MAKKPTFELRLGKLEEIVRDLEVGEIGLEDAVTKYQEGMKLLKELQSHLDEMEKRIETLTTDGETEPFSPPGSALGDQS